MNDTIDYAEMLEIPVNTLNVTKKRSKKRREEEDLKERVLDSVNEKMDVSSSMQARVAGIAVLIVTGILYFTFSGLWF